MEYVVWSGLRKNTLGKVIKGHRVKVRAKTLRLLFLFTHTRTYQGFSFFVPHFSFPPGSCILPSSVPFSVFFLSFFFINVSYFLHLFPAFPSLSLSLNSFSSCIFRIRDSHHPSLIHKSRKKLPQYRFITDVFSLYMNHLHLCIVFLSVFEYLSRHLFCNDLPLTYRTVH